VERAAKLSAGGMPRKDGKRRKPWKPRMVNLFLFTLGQVLEDAVRQGLVAGNVVALVGRLPQQGRPMSTFTEDEVMKLLDAARGDSLEHAWHLALYGLRRGEVARRWWPLTAWQPSTRCTSSLRRFGVLSSSVVHIE